MEMRMSEIRKISAYSATLVVFSLALSAAGSFEAKAGGRSHQNAGAGGGRPHQNLSGPHACAALQSETPAYRDCIAAETPSKTKTIKADTQLKAEPNSSSKTAGILNAGTQVALLERTANGFWCHVQSSGLRGYVPFDALN
jgi:uncharacterized protein YgiM (DUF1202 family)